MKSKRKIENILKNYFTTYDLPIYLYYYPEAVENFDKVLFDEIAKIQHGFSHVDNDVIYVLTYALREILKEESKIDYKAENRAERELKKTQLQIGHLLLKIEDNKHRDTDFSIVYCGKTFKFEDTKVFENFNLFVKKMFNKTFSDEESSGESSGESGDPLYITVDILEYLYEPYLKTRNEPSPYVKYVKIFAFSVFKYLSDDSMLHPITGVPTRIYKWNEKHFSPKVSHLHYIARLYQLAHVIIGQKSEHLKNSKNKIVDTNIFKLRDGKIPTQFSDVIKKHIKDFRLMHKLISPTKGKD